jgi:chromodomain-helicase-DNA-binding protein 1
MLERLILEAYSTQGDIVPQMIVGGMDPEASAESARMFGYQGGFAVLIGTIAAMGTGLNLQTASVAIFVEISYVPDENDQALSRLHREGQENTVNAYYFVAKGTIEEYIREQVLIKHLNITKLLNEHAMAQEMSRLGGL